jgi:glyoxylase-like metal-dependent hydrolase (beta-lactamase superfamily II)
MFDGTTKRKRRNVMKISKLAILLVLGCVSTLAYGGEVPGDAKLDTNLENLFLYGTDKLAGLQINTMGIEPRPNQPAWRILMPIYRIQDEPREKRIVKLRDNIYRGIWGSGGSAYSMLFAVTDEGIILTDPLNQEFARWLKPKLASQFGVPVKYIIYSHPHYDHIAGADNWPDATIIAHEDTDQRIREIRLPIRLPDKTFEKALTVSLGETSVTAQYVGRCHSVGMTVIQFPKSQILMTVDFCPPNALPYLQLMDGYPEEWIKALKRVQEMDFEIMEAGHYELGKKEQVRLNIEYMETLYSRVRELVSMGASRDLTWRLVWNGVDPAKMERFKEMKGWDRMWIPNARGMWERVSLHHRGQW